MIKNLKTQNSTTKILNLLGGKPQMGRGYTLQRLNANSMNPITGDFVLPKLPAANTMYPPFEQSLAKHVYNIFLTLTLTPQEDLSSFDFHDQILNPYFIDRY